jgi:hypothetical protein
MKMMLRFCSIGACVALAACAQSSTPAVPAVVAATAPAADVMGDLLKDVTDAQKKMVDLANAMPESSMNWRPMPGVRSVREVFLHIAGENYFAPVFFGVAPPAATGLSTSDYKTAGVYETRDIPKAQVVSELQDSFENLKKAMTADSDAKLGDKMDFWGQPSKHGAAWIGTVTHLHEHLGQAIAYARSNKIVPPWSK